MAARHGWVRGCESTASRGLIFSVPDPRLAVHGMVVRQCTVGSRAYRRQGALVDPLLWSAQLPSPGPQRCPRSLAQRPKDASSGLPSTQPDPIAAAFQPVIGAMLAAAYVAGG